MSANEPNKEFNDLKNKFSGGSRPPKNKRPFNFYWIYAIVILVIISLNLFTFGPTAVPLTYTEFEKMVEEGHVERITVVNESVAQVTIKRDYLEREPHDKKIKNPTMGSKLTGPHYRVELGSMREDFGSKLDRWYREDGVMYEFRTEDNWGREIFSWVLFLGIMIAIWMFVMRRISGSGGPGGQIFNIGKSKAQLFEKGKSTNVTFKDVAGLEGAKEELEEIVDFLKTPDKYTLLGAKIPKGALLVGPPGTGKTLLAKAVAGEAQVPFFSLSGSDFVEMFVGVGASRVRDLFKQAKEKAPAIIFIDEIDAIGRARGKSANMGANDERENTLNQLLTEMDGFGTNSGVIILAATNRADILDRALMRAGRFDRQIFVDMPDLVERKQILAVHLKPIKTDDTVDIEFLAKQTPGFSGADIANICNEAALIAARKKKKTVGSQDFLDAVDRIIGGLEKKNKIISDDEKKVIAYHESGHATVSWLLEHASPLVKVTIVPRGRSLGAAWYLPEERQITTTEQMLDEMCAALGGRAAEKVIFDKISTGALSDLEKVTKQAYAMVSIYGLNDNVGNISYYDSSGGEYSFTKPYSEKTAQTIDEEVHKLIESQYERAVQLLTENRDKLDQLADKLLKDEVIFKDDLQKIFGKRPFEKDEAPLSETADADTTPRVNGKETPAAKDEAMTPPAEEESASAPAGEKGE
ncbi:MAG: ATP-dependent metallopeptidase FtsH/Yme1/Tma family protein [Cryomorphaceae bacterium]|nr:MAG: ATP-dependent metallopeptidase FtsH/Yme1/Tma family protein [Cryomorphaceae bacterium]